jgi:hypothetical protein
MMRGSPARSRDRGGRRAARGAGRLSVATVLGVVGSIALFGCGAAKAPVVASVQGSAISQSALAHWTAIKRIELQSSPKPTSSSPDVEQKALAFLITSEWLKQEAAARGISVSASEVNANYRRLLNGPNGPNFANSLKRRGLSSADELLILRLGALGRTLSEKIAGPRHGVLRAEQRQRLSAFVAAYRQHWKQRTSCRPGYVIAECSNGPPLPSSTGSGP